MAILLCGKTGAGCSYDTDYSRRFVISAICFAKIWAFKQNMYLVFDVRELL